MGNSAFGIQIKNGRPIGGAFLYGGIAPDNQPDLGGTALVVPLIVYGVTIDEFGQGRQPLPLPSDDPYLIGFDIYFQAIVLDQSLPDQFSITPGIMMTICE